MALEWKKLTFDYKVVDNCAIQADVYQVPGRKNQPVVLWIHGGALIFGRRSGIAPYQLGRYLHAGFTVVSIDYRLAPETKLPSIIEDLKDAMCWVHEQGSELFAIDLDRIAVIGHSAGGYLALMSGFVADFRPKAIVSFYGYGDIIGAWYSRPDPWYCSQGMISIDEAYETIGDQSCTDGGGKNRFLFYLYCRQYGLWPREVGGQDPHENPGWFSRFCPIQNVTAAYPPTLLIHGDQDTDVPFQQSVEMEAALAQHRVAHKFVRLFGKGHAFDEAREAQADSVVSGCFDEVVEFLRQNGL